jgi:hypothetical protein
MPARVNSLARAAFAAGPQQVRKFSMIRSLLPLGAAVLLAGCSTLGVAPDRDRPAPEPSFAGRLMTVVAANGQASTLRFERDGTVRAIFGKQETQGRWRLDDGDLCFTWAAEYKECWKDVGEFERRRTRTITSNRGNVVKVTLQ